MAVKIIATDLDGTLMAPDHITVTERTKAALLNAHKKGIKIAIATGRTLGFITPVINQIPFTDYVIFSNGASVYDLSEKKIIYKNHIPPNLTAEILAKLNDSKVYYNTYVDGTAYIQENKQQFYSGRELPAEFLKIFMDSSVLCENLCETLKGQSAEIIAVYSTDESVRQTLSEYFQKSELLVTASLKDEIEATIPSANKGDALSHLCGMLNITSEEAMSFGDAMNDMQMIEFAKYSFAMGNACEELKKKARYIALSNAEDGLAKAVEEYAL